MNTTKRRQSIEIQKTPDTVTRRFLCSVFFFITSKRKSAREIPELLSTIFVASAEYLFG